MGFGSGGGGSSGEVSFPEYMENRHDAWLADVTTAMNEARTGLSPYAGFVTVDPAAVFGGSGLQAFDALGDLSSFDVDARFASHYSMLADHNAAIPGALSESDIATITNAEADRLAATRDSKVLPSFEAGMRNINAVVSSAFVLGRANIEGEMIRDLAALDAKLRAQNPSLGIEAARVAVQQNQSNHETARALAGAEQELSRQVVVLAAEIGRIYSAARLDVDKTEMEFAAKDRLFDLETFQYGSNVMAGIQGGTASKSSQGSTTQNAIGGALSGAAAGASVAALAGATGGAALPYIGIGAALGLAGGLFS